MVFPQNSLIPALLPALDDSARGVMPVSTDFCFIASNVSSRPLRQPPLRAVNVAANRLSRVLDMIIRNFCQPVKESPEIVTLHTSAGGKTQNIDKHPNH